MWFLCLTGLFLLLLNVSGFFLNLRNQEIYAEQRIPDHFKTTLRRKEFYDKIENAKIRPINEYLHLINDAVDERFAHYWWDEGVEKYNLRIPPSENFLLFLAGYLKPEIYRKYEICDVTKAIERGIGMCTQQSGVLSKILEENHVENTMWLLRRHTVVTAQASNGWWILDPDYGVIIPHDEASVMRDPKIIIPYYKEKGFDDNAIATLVDIYGKDGPIGTNGTWEQYNEHYNKKFCDTERWLYIGKWTIPFILLLLSAFLYKTYRKRC